METLAMETATTPVPAAMSLWELATIELEEFKKS